MAKVRYEVGDTAGQVGYMSYPEIQEALKADPESLTILDGKAEADDPESRKLGHPADNAERGEVVRSPVAAADLSEEVDPTVVRTLGHGTAGADAMRVGESVHHRAEVIVPTSAGVKDQEGVDPKKASVEGAQKVVDEQNEAEAAAKEATAKAAEAAAKNREASAENKGSASQPPKAPAPKATEKK